MPHPSLVELNAETPVESAVGKSEVEASAAETLPGKVSAGSSLLGIGGAALFASVALCASSHVILRGAASANAESANLIALFLDPRIVGGLFLYASGTALWLLCLSRLDLSLAFPASAVQLIIVYAGARWFLGEEIPMLRLVGAGVILLGIGLLFLEGRRRHV